MNVDLSIINLKIKNFLINFRLENPKIMQVVAAIVQAGGRAILVGGAVRDLLLGQSSKDFDIEVYGLDQLKLVKILNQFGSVQQVGKAFGVYILPGLAVDWSLPRIDGEGRKPFVQIAPNLAFKQAFLRRDLTINALGIDLILGELIDPFNGLEDLQAKRLRYVDCALFGQDPLRFYRVMQFVGRLEMLPDQALNDLCVDIDLSAVSHERIVSEFTKLFLKSHAPSLGIRWLRQIGRLAEILPEIYQTIGVEQDAKWHPEGDVFEHVMQALDCASRQDYDSEEQKLLVMLAALCHDLGKITTTKLIKGKWSSIGHAQAGVALTKRLLSRITNNHDLIKSVCNLVRYHMEPLQFINNQAGLVAYKKLAYKLAPQNIDLLVKLALADRLGRNVNKYNLPVKISLEQDVDLQKFVAQAQLAHIYFAPLPAILRGSDLLDVFVPGPALGKALDRAYLIQLQSNITDKFELKKALLKLKKR